MRPVKILLADRLSLLRSGEPLEDSEAWRRQVFVNTSGCEFDLLPYLPPISCTSKLNPPSSGAAVGIEPIKFLQDKPVASAKYGPVLNWFLPLLKLTLPDIVRSPRSPSYLKRARN